MPSNLQQMQLGYDQVQDRLILSLYTQDFCEFRFWITRRAVKGVWDILNKLLAADQKSKLQHDLESKKAQQAILQEKAHHQPTADKLSQKMTRRPFGDEPVLLAKIMAKQGDKGTFLLHFENLKGHSVEFGCDSVLVTALCQLILQALNKTDWDVKLE